MRKPRVPARGSFFIGCMTQERVISFIDGFNLYHSIKDLDKPYLKWVNLRTLASTFVSTQSQLLTEVFYFSAYANHLPDSKKRHLEYVKALTASGVSPVMGNFKKKQRRCPNCRHNWNGHEEKRN